MKTNKEMIADVTEQVIAHNKKQRARRKTAAAILAVMTVFVCLAVAAGAAGRWAVFSPEWREELINSAQNAGTADGVEEFKTKRAASDDILAQDDNYLLLPDRENEVPVNVTQTGKDYTFTLESIMPVEELRNRLVSGSLAHGDMKFEWQVSNEYYALVRVSRVDGTAMSYEEDPFFHFHRYIEGYNPFMVNMCLEGDGAFSVLDGDSILHVVNVTKLVAFADRTLVLAPTEINGTYDAQTYLYAAKDEPIVLKDTAPDNVVLLKFDLPDSMVDKQVQKELLKDHEEMFNNFRGYEK